MIYLSRCAKWQRISSTFTPLFCFIFPSRECSFCAMKGTCPATQRESSYDTRQPVNSTGDRGSRRRSIALSSIRLCLSMRAFVRCFRPELFIKLLQLGGDAQGPRLTVNHDRRLVLLPGRYGIILIVTMSGHVLCVCVTVYFLPRSDRIPIYLLAARAACFARITGRTRVAVFNGVRCDRVARANNLQCFPKM